MQSHFLLVALGVILTAVSYANAHGRFKRQEPGEAPWGYGSYPGFLGPTAWHTAYPTCGGHRQSPVAIDAAHLQQNSLLKPLRFVDYDDRSINDTWSMKNNGHSVQITGNFYTRPQLQGGSLPGKYAFQQLHFHWGSNDRVGSEHLLAGRRHPMEIHIVHDRKDLADDVVAEYGDGMAVVGIMCELHEEHNPLITAFIEALQKIENPGSATSVVLPGFSMQGLIPKNRSYVRYLGSLTTPPCSEAVVWSVMTSPLTISQSQLDALRKLLARTSVILEDNFRPLQPLNGRVLQYFSDNGNPINSC